MTSRQIIISLVLGRLHSVAEGKAFLKFLADELTDINLTKLDVTEPLKRSFDLDDLEHVWQAPGVFFSGINTEGAISFTDDHYVPSVFELTTSADFVSTQQARHFLRAAAVQFDCQFGVVDRDVKRNGYSEILLSIHQLRRGIPNIYWWTVLGEPYVRLIGGEKLIHAPLWNAELIDHRIALLELTPQMSDMWERPEDVEDARSATRDYIGEALFENDDTALIVPPEFSAGHTDEHDLPRVSAQGVLDTARLERESEMFAQVAASDDRKIEISSKTVSQLDRLIDELWEDPEARGTGRAERQSVDAIAPALGSFLGEIMVRELGGVWALDNEGNTGIRFSTGAWTYPHEKAVRRLSSGHADSLNHYYAVVRELLAN